MRRYVSGGSGRENGRGERVLSVAGDARFIPSPAHLERVLHLLQQYYPRQETSVCRLALARMFGHEGWGERIGEMKVRDRKSVV